MANSLVEDIHEISPQQYVVAEVPAISDYWMRQDFAFCALIYDPNLQGKKDPSQALPHTDPKEIAEERNKPASTIANRDKKLNEAN